MNRKKAEKLSDIDLIDKYKQSGNSDFIGVLFERYYALCYGVCLKYLKDKEKSKDVVINVFEKILNSSDNLEISSFNSWLYSVAKNQCLMLLRTEKRRVEREKIYSENIDLSINIDNEAHKELVQAVKQLDSGQKECISLLYFEKKSYKEISEITGYPMKKVKSYIQNGKRNLKKILNDYVKK
ncbi:MAG: sigma-70 family RNA polymerase sigma factor [Marinilabiliales bacterium]